MKAQVGTVLAEGFLASKGDIVHLGQLWSQLFQQIPQLEALGIRNCTDTMSAMEIIRLLLSLPTSFRHSLQLCTRVEQRLMNTSQLGAEFAKAIKSDLTFASCPLLTAIARDIMYGVGIFPLTSFENGWIMFSLDLPLKPFQFSLKHRKL